MSQETNLSILSQQTASYTTTASWVNVPQFVITVPTGEDGNYDIAYSCNARLNADSEGSNTRIAIDGNPISSTAAAAIWLAGGTNMYIRDAQTILNIPLKAASVVSLQAIYDTNAGVIEYAAGLREGYLQIIKRGV